MPASAQPGTNPAVVHPTVMKPPPPNASCGPLTWPTEAIRYELEGQVTVLVRLNAEGRAADVKVARSSGWGLLDDASVAYARACRYSPQQVAYWHDGQFSMELTWRLDSENAVSDPVLVPDSCAHSPVFKRFAARNEAAASDDSVQVRFLIDKQGKPYGVKSERSQLPQDVARQVPGFVESCRFGYDPAGPDIHDDATYGRVILR